MFACPFVEGDEEETIKEQEKIEKEQNHVEEVDELQEEGT